MREQLETDEAEFTANRAAELARASPHTQRAGHPLTSLPSHPIPIPHPTHTAPSTKLKLTSSTKKLQEARLRDLSTFACSRSAPQSAASFSPNNGGKLPGRCAPPPARLLVRWPFSRCDHVHRAARSSTRVRTSKRSRRSTPSSSVRASLHTHTAASDSYRLTVSLPLIAQTMVYRCQSCRTSIPCPTVLRRRW